MTVTYESRSLYKYTTEVLLVLQAWWTTWCRCVKSCARRSTCGKYAATTTRTPAAVLWRRVGAVPTVISCSHGVAIMSDGSSHASASSSKTSPPNRLSTSVVTRCLPVFIQGIFLRWNPPQNLTSPPKRLPNCVLKIFLFGRDNESQMYHGNFLTLMDNKHRKLFVVKQSKGAIYA